MDTENPPKTIIGSLVQRISQPKYDPTENERKLMILLKLGSHYWAHDFTRAQATAFLADYLDDLQSVLAPDLDQVCRQWRTNADKTRYPRSGELIRMANENSGVRARQRLTFKASDYEIAGLPATKSADQILAEHGLQMPARSVRGW